MNYSNRKKGHKIAYSGTSLKKKAGSPQRLVVNLLFLCGLVLCCSFLVAETTSQTQQNQNISYSEGEGQKKYPESWDISIIPGTKLETLAKNYDKKTTLLPTDDLADQAPMPKWFRAFLREKLVGLPTKGRPQYPREAKELLLWLKKNQDFHWNELNSRLKGFQQKVHSVKNENERRAMYPPEWEVEVPAGTKLDKLRKRLDAEINLIPEKDLEDSTPIPIWFRIYMRKQFSELPKSGKYQYPRTASRILYRLLSNPDANEIDVKED